jgi:head-tail adaptor
MQPGKLRNRAEILSLDASLAPVGHGSRWVGIRAKETGDVPAATGLRSRAMIEVRARYSADLLAGRYLKNGARLLHITSARDPMGDRAELVLSCDELVGEVAEYRPDGLPPVACRVHLTHSAPYLDDMGQVTDYRTRAEVALIEVGRPQVDDQLEIGGQLYSVIAYADESDDGVVRGLWLAAI